MDYGIAILSGVVDLVVLGNCDAREAGAKRESIVPNPPHRWGDGDACESGAIRESPVPNLRHRFWDGDAREAGAKRDSIVPNLRHRFWDGDACEAGAIQESNLSNLRHILVKFQYTYILVRNITVLYDSPFAKVI